MYFWSSIQTTLLVLQFHSQTSLSYFLVFLDRRWSIEEKNNFLKSWFFFVKNPEDSVLPALGKKLVCGWDGRAGMWGEAEKRAGPAALWSFPMGLFLPFCKPLNPPLCTWNSELCFCHFQNRVLTKGHGHVASPNTSGKAEALPGNTGEEMAHPEGFYPGERTSAPWTCLMNISPVFTNDLQTNQFSWFWKLIPLTTHFGHLMQRGDSLEKTLMLGKIEGRRRRGWQRMRWLDDIIDSMGMTLSKLQKMVKEKGGLVCCSPWGRKESDIT